MSTHQRSEIQHIEEQIAQVGAQLIESIIRLARISGAGDPDAERVLSSLQNCSVTITAVGPQLHVEARANVDESQYRLWAGTFNEQAAH
jgi:hypothetical protein